MGKTNLKVLVHPSSDAKETAADSIIAEISGIVNDDEKCQHDYDPALLINIDFRKRPDLLEVLRGLADNQFRTVQQQIMFILNEFCSEYIYDKKD